MHKFIKLAAEAAVSSNPNDPRDFIMGAVGIRADGVIVSARNGSVQTSETIGHGWSFPPAHAEIRCSKKMDVGGIIYVVRISKKNKELVLAKPCKDCEAFLRARGIARVCYSISDTEYETLDL